MRIVRVLSFESPSQSALARPGSCRIVGLFSNRFDAACGLRKAYLDHTRAEHEAVMAAYKASVEALEAWQSDEDAFQESVAKAAEDGTDPPSGEGRAPKPDLLPVPTPLEVLDEDFK